MHPTTGTVLATVDPVGNDTIGSLAWSGRHILVANVTNGAGAINFIDPNTGAQVDSVAVPAGRGEGLAKRQRYLYYSTVNKIHVIRRSTGDVVRSFPPPGGACRALTYGGGYLFSGNSATGKITIFNPRTLKVRGTIPAPGNGSAQVEGLAYRRATRKLYVANQSENKIYVIRVTL
jgi:DNA-binding beta-propeller fold protein YncE